MKGMKPKQKINPALLIGIALFPMGMYIGFSYLVIDYLNIFNNPDVWLLWMISCFVSGIVSGGFAKRFYKWWILK